MITIFLHIAEIRKVKNDFFVRFKSHRFKMGISIVFIGVTSKASYLHHGAEECNKKL